MRSAIRFRRWTALGAAAVLAGCVDLTGLLDLRPPSLVERDGLGYQVIVSPHGSDRFEYRVRVTNTSHHTIERRLPRHLAEPRVYQDHHWTRPVWDPCGWGCDHPYDYVWVRLRSGEAVEGWRGTVWVRDFARARGVYHLTVMIDTGRDRFEVLGLPELRVY